MAFNGTARSRWGGAAVEFNPKSPKGPDRLIILKYGP